MWEDGTPGVWSQLLVSRAILSLGFLAFPLKTPWSSLLVPLLPELEW